MRRELDAARADADRGWSFPLPGGDLPWIDACDAAFFEPPEVEPSYSCNTKSAEHTENTSDNDEGEGGRRERDDAKLAPPTAVAELAIAGALPTQPGQRHRFVLAQRLKRVPTLRNKPGPALRRYAEAWRQRAYPVIGKEPFEETWIDFLKAWDNVSTLRSRRLERRPRGSAPGCPTSRTTTNNRRSCS